MVRSNTSQTPGWRDSRSVSEVFGTVLILSLSLASALLLVGVGTVLLDHMESDTEDALTQDAMVEMDNRLAQISGTSVDATTSFSFPQGANVQAEPQAGHVNITIETLDRYWDEDETYRLVGATQQVNYTEKSLGTILHEASDGTVVASQGGGLWEMQGSSVQMVNPPPLDYRGNTLDLSLRSIGTDEPIGQGQEVRASYNVTASQELSEEIERYIEYQQSIPGTSMSAGFYINVTITSDFIDGWVYHAEEVMQRPPEIVYGPGEHPELAEDQAKLVFGPYGDTMAELDEDPNWGMNICYTGLSQYVPIYAEDTQECNVAPREEGGFYVETTNQFEVGVYDGNEWIIHNNMDEEWRPIFEDGPVGAPDEVIEYETGPGSDTYFHIEENTPVCVAWLSGGAMFDGDTYYVGDWKPCIDEMVGVEDPQALEPKPSKYLIEDVSVDKSVVAVGEELEVTVDVSNVGIEKEPHSPLALVFDGQVVAGEEEISIEPNQITPESYTFTIEPESTGEGEFIAATDDDNEASEAVEIVPVTSLSDFQVDTVTVLEKDLTVGDDLTVEATIHNDGSVTDEQHVRMYLDHGDESLLDSTAVELGPGGFETVTLSAPTRSKHQTEDGTISVRTDDDEGTDEGITVEESDESGEFTVLITDADDPVTEGETLNVTAEIANIGPASDTQSVTLHNFEGLPVDVQSVELDQGESTERTLTWQPGYDVVTDGDDFLVDTIEVHSNDHDDERQVHVDNRTPETRSPYDVYLAMDETGSLHHFYRGDRESYTVGNCYMTITGEVCVGEYVPDGESWRVEHGDYRLPGDYVSYGTDVLIGDLGEDPWDDRYPAAESFIDELHEDDRVGAYQWDNDQYLLHGLTTDHDAVTDTFEPDVGGGTYTTSALEHGVNRLTNEGNDDHNQALVLFTDGLHSSSATYDRPLDEDTFEDGKTIAEVAADRNITIHTVGLGSNLNETSLQGVADQAGGVYVHVEDPEDLEEAFETVTEEFDTEEAEFLVTDVDTDEQVKQGETVTVDAEIENAGDDAGTQTVVLQADNAIVDDKEVPIGQSKSKTVSLDWDTSAFDPGETTVTVATEDDTGETTITVTEAEPDTPYYRIDSVDPDDPVTTDETLTVDAEVRNMGEADGSQILTLSAHIDGEWVTVDALDSPLVLQPTDSETVTFTWSDLGGIEPGEYDLRVESDEDYDDATAVISTQEVSLTVERIEAFDQDGNQLDPGDNVSNGDDVDVDVTVRNEGDDTVEASPVELRVDSQSGDLIGFAMVTIDPGETETLEFRWDTTGYASESDREVVAVTETHQDGFPIEVTPLEYEATHSPFAVDETINIDVDEIDVES